MKTFQDNAGRQWTVTLNVAALKRVRAMTSVDLFNVVTLDENKKPDISLLERLSEDPILLVDVLYSVCKPEADTQNVSDEQFGAAMAGDAIEHATNALLEELVDFFPDPKRKVLRKILAANRRFGETMKKKVEAELVGLDAKIDQALEQLSG